MTAKLKGNLKSGAGETQQNQFLVIIVRWAPIRETATESRSESEQSEQDAEMIKR